MSNFFLIRIVPAFLRFGIMWRDFRRRPSSTLSADALMTGGILDRGCSHFQALVNKPSKIVAPCVELRLYAWELEHNQGSYIKLIGDYLLGSCIFSVKIYTWFVSDFTRVPQELCIYEDFPKYLFTYFLVLSVQKQQKGLNIQSVQNFVYKVWK